MTGPDSMDNLLGLGLVSEDDGVADEETLARLTKYYHQSFGDGIEIVMKWVGFNFIFIFCSYFLHNSSLE